MYGCWGGVEMTDSVSIVSTYTTRLPSQEQAGSWLIGKELEPGPSHARCVILIRAHHRTLSPSTFRPLGLLGHSPARESTRLSWPPRRISLRKAWRDVGTRHKPQTVAFRHSMFRVLHFDREVIKARHGKFVRVSKNEPAEGH